MTIEERQMLVLGTKRSMKNNMMLNVLSTDYGRHYTEKLKGELAEKWYVVLNKVTLIAAEQKRLVG